MLLKQNFTQLHSGVMQKKQNKPASKRAAGEQHLCGCGGNDHASAAQS